MGAYLLLIFNTHISFQSCIRRSTTDTRRSPRQHPLKQLYKDESMGAVNHRLCCILRAEI